MQRLLDLYEQIMFSKNGISDHTEFPVQCSNKITQEIYRKPSFFKSCV